MTPKFRRAILLTVGFVTLTTCLFPLFWPVRPDRTLGPLDKSQTEAISGLPSLTPEQRSSLKARERQRLIAEPLDLTAFNNLALLENAEGNRAQVDALLLEASRRSMRDPLAQFAAMQQGLEKADYVNAFRNLNGLLTVVPKVSQDTFPLVYQKLDDPKAIAALASALNSNPAWRLPLFQWLTKNDKDFGITYDLISVLRASGGHESISELQTLTAQLITLKNYDKAYYLWLDSLDVSALALVSGIFDSKFTQVPKNLYFDWNIIPTENVTINIGYGSASDQQSSLRLDFSLATKKFQNVYQFLRLTPGNYILGGEWQAHNFGGGEGLVWSLSCMEVSKTIGTSTRFKTSMPPTPFKFKVTVPSTGCDTQFLILTSASDLVLEQALDGEIVFNEVYVKKIELGQNE